MARDPFEKDINRMRLADANSMVISEDCADHTRMQNFPRSFPSFSVPFSFPSKERSVVGIASREYDVTSD